ncbi:YggS family pyridoxal phosphate-dependent enzyme [Turneriella parva]|uniref:Pyridoxal phosphate homeostasis protein n=1 Tax=Turneriella parva (strain ATCC BAA-1111 / DSM 21527 / NCTC 11395 / H) TaxID=869212 RepID=I4BAW2_TURPD|nr:YggS family pyridoxal phosphate-dependent enzyme [Turneriella parva]AFM14419.1 protein of unknown function UPF0001 [Turneriella parva DSM 21527]
MNLNERFNQVLAEIGEAAMAAGRPADSVNLIAVSKTHPVSLVDELAQLGQVHFAENRIAELTEKQAAARATGLQWHLIGQLQTNKVKLLNAGTILHSLDRLSLAEKLQQQFAADNIRCLIQVNCSGEPNKSGVAPADFDALAEAIAKKPAIRVLGLMTMAEHSDDERVVRRAFADLRELSERLAAQKIFPGYENWLSMGMSGDFRYAIAEGATHVRIGTAIFGHR